jgi:hypothetical protein
MGFDTVERRTPEDALHQPLRAERSEFQSAIESTLWVVSLPCPELAGTVCSLFQSKDEPGEEAGRWWRKFLSGLDSEPI